MMLPSDDDGNCALALSAVHILVDHEVASSPLLSNALGPSSVTRELDGSTVLTDAQLFTVFL